MWSRSLGIDEIFFIFDLTINSWAAVSFPADRIISLSSLSISYLVKTKILIPVSVEYITLAWHSEIPGTIDIIFLGIFVPQYSEFYNEAVA